MQREAFLALYLVFIYSYFPDFHAPIFDFYNALAEFYSHICDFLSFSNAVYRAKSLPGRSYNYLFFWPIIYIIHLVFFSVFFEQVFHSSSIVLYPELRLFVQCDI
ncbi:hypothetical protein GQ607_004704 [Colletotrichum asianum]|uniref:Uncharacterized protein n=1 Tax=Colletotrichum asianum TaxID=702518 RepID=A0A8H3WJ40_9PEZI|nr:hypothetical protein GQ607_004704 [Colletotrichum asianum]